MPQTPTTITPEMWSGRRDLNPRHQPWQGCALPLSYARMGGEGYQRPRAAQAGSRGWVGGTGLPDREKGVRAWRMPRKARAAVVRLHPLLPQAAAHSRPRLRGGATSELARRAAPSAGRLRTGRPSADRPALVRAGFATAQSGITTRRGLRGRRALRRNGNAGSHPPSPEISPSPREDTFKQGSVSSSPIRGMSPRWLRHDLCGYEG